MISISFSVGKLQPSKTALSPKSGSQTVNHDGKRGYHSPKVTFSPLKNGGKGNQSFSIGWKAHESWASLVSFREGISGFFCEQCFLFIPPITNSFLKMFTGENLEEKLQIAWFPPCYSVGEGNCLLSY